MSHQTTGKNGEAEAQRWYLEQGYKILHQNYQCYLRGRQGRRAEVDLIALKDNIVVLVEVKTRTSKIFGSAIQQITAQKIQNLRLAYQYFLIKHPQYRSFNFRIDIVSIDGGILQVIQNSVTF